MAQGVEVDSVAHVADHCAIKVDRLGPDDTLVRFGGSDTGVTLSLTDRALRRLTDALGTG